METAKLRTGLKWGLLTGLLLGSLNTFVILSVYPSLGYDITFLKQTPHGRLPVFLMVPWLICGIALFVEVNFRGFLLGRLAEREPHWLGNDSNRRLAPLALIASTLTFAFDPFMVNTFRRSPPDRPMGGTHLGKHLAPNPSSLHDHRGPCSRSYHHV